MKIDKQVLKFIFALLIVGFVIEIVDNIDHRAAWLLTIVLETGILINNPLALSLITVGGYSLGDTTK